MENPDLDEISTLFFVFSFILLLLLPNSRAGGSWRAEVRNVRTNGRDKLFAWLPRSCLPYCPSNWFNQMIGSLSVERTGLNDHQSLFLAFEMAGGSILKRNMWWEWRTGAVLGSVQPASHCQYIMYNTQHIYILPLLARMIFCSCFFRKYSSTSDYNVGLKILSLKT